MSDIERELNWDDEISKESDFVLIPEGDYNFTVASVERARHEGSQNLPPCAKAIVTLKIQLLDGTEQRLKHNLFLHSRCEGLLSQFFIGIGLKKKGEPLRMNWNAVPGTSGRCKITIRSWVDKNGETKQSNDVKKFYDSRESPVTPPAPVRQPEQPQNGIFTPGKF